MAKSIVFLTGDRIAGNATESIHLYRRIVSFSEECCIAIINKGNMDLPSELHREHVLKMRDMSIGTGLMFLSMYCWMMDLVEE